MDEGGLVGNLGNNLVVRAAHNLVYAVGDRDAGLDHGLGAVTGGEVDGHIDDVDVGLGQHIGGGVDIFAGHPIFKT